jgi:hypothetical protein
MPVSLASTASAVTHGAMVPIAWYPTTGSTSGVSFSNIPQNYAHLMLVTYGRDSRAVVAENVLIAPNTNTSGIYSYISMSNGNSSGAGQTTRAEAQGFGVAFDAFTGSSATTGVNGSSTSYILNYANTTNYKTILSQATADNNGSGDMGMVVNLSKDTAAISSLYVITYNNLNAGGYIALYGIRGVGQ